VPRSTPRAASLAPLPRVAVGRGVSWLAWSGEQVDCWPCAMGMGFGVWVISWRARGHLLLGLQALSKAAELRLVSASLAFPPAGTLWALQLCDPEQMLGLFVLHHHS
jgi:hypothetical protein